MCVCLIHICLIMCVIMCMCICLINMSDVCVCYVCVMCMCVCISDVCWKVWVLVHWNKSMGQQQEAASPSPLLPWRPHIPCLIWLGSRITYFSRLPVSTMAMTWLPLTWVTLGTSRLVSCSCPHLLACHISLMPLDALALASSKSHTLPNCLSHTLPNAP